MDMSTGDFMTYHEDTELRLGLPGSNEVDNQSLVRSSKRSFSSISNEPATSSVKKSHEDLAPPTKLQVIGWPPVKSYRKHCLQATKVQAESASQFLKVSVDGAPYLRKIDLHLYKGYKELLKTLEDMFKLKADQLSNRDINNQCSEYEPAYEDKDGDWMLVGDVPWELFITSCKRLRIMKRS